MKRAGGALALCQALVVLLLPAAAALPLRKHSKAPDIPVDVCAPSLPKAAHAPSPEKQWLDAERDASASGKSARLVHTHRRIDLVQEVSQEPGKGKTKATYKYIGCYLITMNKTHLLEPEAPPSSMTVTKCHNFCHDAELAGEKLYGGKPQFFLLKGGKECRCSHYVDKDPSVTDEKMCSESCEGDETEKCGGRESESVYVMIDCPILPKSKTQKIKERQLEEAQASAEEDVMAEQNADAEEMGMPPVHKKKEKTLSDEMAESKEAIATEAKDAADEKSREIEPINSPYKIKAAPSAPSSCGGVRCFEPVCPEGFKKGHVQGNCCYTCIPG